MVYNLNRIYSGLFIISLLIFFYIFQLDLILLSILTIFICYEISINKLYNFKTLPFLILTFIYCIYFENFIFNNKIILLFILLFILLLSLYKFKYFIFFNLILLFFVISSYELLQSNRYLFYLIILISFINDSSAYFFGKLIKGPLIISTISPNKTWSGTSLSIIISFYFLYYYFDFTFIISTLVSLLFFLGDIYFSFIKRKNNIKDFSNIIPGHGGLLDRIDSFLFPIILVNLSI